MNENYSVLDTVGLKKKAVKGTGFNVAGNLIGFFFHTIGVIVLSHVLDPKDFGLVTMVTAFSMLPMNFGVNGFIAYIIQVKYISKDEILSIFWLHIYVSIFFVAFFICFGFFLVNFYHEPSLSAIAAVMSSTFILSALYTTPRALLRREMKFGAIAIGNLSSEILSIVLAIAAALCGMGYWAVVTRQIVKPVVTMISAWFFCPLWPSYPRGVKKAIPGFKYGLKVYINFILDYFSKSLDRILLGKFFGSSNLGNYDRAYQLSSFPAGQILSPLNSVMQATLSRLRFDKARFKVYYFKAVSLASFLGTMASVILLLTSDDLVPLLLGQGWDETTRIIKAFSPGIAATLIYGTYSWLHLSLGTPGKWFRWNVFSTIITVIAFSSTAPFGAIAVAIAYSASRYILVLPSIWYAGRPVQLNIFSIVQSVWSYFISGIITSLVWLYLVNLYEPFKLFFDSLNIFYRLGFTICFSVIFYTIIVIALQRNFFVITELSSFFKILISRRKSKNRCI